MFQDTRTDNQMEYTLHQSLQFSLNLIISFIEFQDRIQTLLVPSRAQALINADRLLLAQQIGKR